ncbi:coth-domain-containing protein [Anaeromyces robustus]|uniref:Coth-domain-containing protein n=1 Tax=Anaeromyces robustus TaxID=1754192 RepID=A0A1Y1XJF0_9FUNG|nr:coth-domain-containing protein [Anaeromyces robustus]|eukprot:ORX85833.1 coth-domain-containing protein [Anaeromyces robustus]
MFKIARTMNSMEFNPELPEDVKVVIIATLTFMLMGDNLQKRDISDNNNQNNQNMAADYPEFKTKKAVLNVEINGENQKFDKVTFKIAGKTARSYSKPPFNLKIRGGQDLFGRSHFKLRPDCADPSLLRTKLVSDIHNRLGVTSLSSNYITLYINEEYMGLYTLNDAFKSSWIEQVYGDKDTTSLYKCDFLFDFDPSSAAGCMNENEDVTDQTELIQFFESVKNAKSASDLEDIFEIDQFLTEMVIEYLTGSWDHLQNMIAGHNFYLYKQPNGKWIYLSYDFDLDFGIPLMNDSDKGSFKDYVKPLHIFDILVFNDPTRFENIMKNVITKAFNPDILYPHIDELKSLIKPFIELDKTPDTNGNYPGNLNTKGIAPFTYEDWDASTEFSTIEGVFFGTIYGLKNWVLMKYRDNCKIYNLECNPTYMDENYPYPTDNDTNTDTNTPSMTSNVTSPASTSINNKCWSELIGYPCCDSSVTTVFVQDDYGDWGYDFNKNEWCGITSYEEKEEEEECWSEPLGYSCCKTCVVYETDTDGSWGYENHQWCGIPSICQK